MYKMNDFTAAMYRHCKKYSTGLELRLELLDPGVRDRHLARHDGNSKCEYEVCKACSIRQFHIVLVQSLANYPKRQQVCKKLQPHGMISL